MAVKSCTWPDGMRKIIDIETRISWHAGWFFFCIATVRLPLCRYLNYDTFLDITVKNQPVDSLIFLIVDPPAGGPVLPLFALLLELEEEAPGI